MIIRCATTNPGKLREFKLAGECFGGGLFSIQTLDAMMPLNPPEETGSTFEENAILKARFYGAQTKDWLFADDSGLEVDALGGAPGIHSARYAGEDGANNDLLLRNLAGVRERGAQFVCVIALVRAGELVKTFRGEVRGAIVDAPQGPNGFGYDPLFYYPPFGCTFGEASEQAKMDVSHRAVALREMFAFLKTQV